MLMPTASIQETVIRAKLFKKATGNDPKENFQLKCYQIWQEKGFSEAPDPEDVGYNSYLKIVGTIAELQINQSALHVETRRAIYQDEVERYRGTLFDKSITRVDCLKRLLDFEFLNLCEQKFFTSDSQVLYDCIKATHGEDYLRQYRSYKAAPILRVSDQDVRAPVSAKEFPDQRVLNEFLNGVFQKEVLDVVLQAEVKKAAAVLNQHVRDTASWSWFNEYMLAVSGLWENSYRRFPEIQIEHLNRTNIAERLLSVYVSPQLNLEARQAMWASEGIRDLLTSCSLQPFLGLMTESMMQPIGQRVNRLKADPRYAVATKALGNLDRLIKRNFGGSLLAQHFLTSDNAKRSLILEDRTFCKALNKAYLLSANRFFRWILSVVYRVMPSVAPFTREEISDQLLLVYQEADEDLQKKMRGNCPAIAKILHQGMSDRIQALCSESLSAPPLSSSALITNCLTKAGSNESAPIPIPESSPSSMRTMKGSSPSLSSHASSVLGSEGGRKENAESPEHSANSLSL